MSISLCPGPEVLSPEETPVRFPAQARPRWRYAVAEVLVLATALSILGAVLIPSHWTSIWMDREFTGWIAPLANRLGSVKLYGPGSHIPLPPLPMLLVHALTQGQATWLTESLLNGLCQALLVLTLYLGLSRFLARPLPFLATFATLPVFFALPKTILYDSIAQLLVAFLGVLVACHVAPSGRRSPWTVALFAFLTAICLLTKQSTGAGVFLGVALALGVITPGVALVWRLRRLGIFALLTGLFLGLLVLALAPYVDVSGLFREVFLTGSEPKGGQGRLARNLLIYVLEFVQHGTPTLVAVGVFLGITLAGPRRAVSAESDDTLDAIPSGAGILLWHECNSCRTARESRPDGSGEPSYMRNFPAGVILWVVYVSACLAPLFVLLFTLAPYKLVALRQGCTILNINLLWIGLLIGLLWLGKALFPRWLSQVRTCAELRPLAAMFLVFLLGAVGHSLSGSRFRWTYDNNPLIVLACAFLLLAVQGTLRSRLAWRGLARVALIAGLVFGWQCLAWASLGEQWLACRTCTETWEEVPYLAGARLAPAADGMRELIWLVRELAPDREADKVLLLPNDPNVEAWFERERPALSSLIVFADQYWDHSVEEDFEALERQLPRVIVIGPRGFWREFHQLWNKDYGAERLIDRVTAELLPAHYRLYKAHPITHKQKADIMDIYVRKDG